jgi:hypothetical protein
MALNVVASQYIVNNFKKSRYFKQNLGLVTTIENNGRRSLNNKDQFSYFYNTQYKTTIYAQGNVCDIKFYVDHYIKDETFAIYTGDNFEEFIYKYNGDIVREKGVDFYLGHLLKDVDEKYDEKVKNDELRKLEERPKGNAENLLKNPGNVTYEDVKAYLELKQKERYKNNNTL